MKAYLVELFIEPPEAKAEGQVMAICAPSKEAVEKWARSQFNPRFSRSSEDALLFDLLDRNGKLIEDCYLLATLYEVQD